MSRVRALVVTEQRLMVWALRQALEEAGVTVTTGASTAELRRHVSEAVFDTIVVQCEIDHEDLSDLIVEIDRTQPGVQLIVLCNGECAGPLRGRLLRGIVWPVPLAVDELVDCILGRREAKGA